MKEIWAMLGQKDIHKKDLVGTALELYVPHPGVESKRKAKKMLEKIFGSIFLDPNVNALVVAGFYLEELAAKGSLPGIERKYFKKDPVFLVADEILGMAIAEYIAGTKARFEYVRFDTKKPGILKKLGPFVDDVICGVIAGVSSKMYSEAIRL